MTANARTSERAKVRARERKNGRADSIEEARGRGTALTLLCLAGKASFNFSNERANGREEQRTKMRTPERANVRQIGACIEGMPCGKRTPRTALIKRSPEAPNFEPFVRAHMNCRCQESTPSGLAKTSLEPIFWCDPGVTRIS